MYEEICHSNFKKYIVPMIDDYSMQKSRFLSNNQIFLIQFPQELNNGSSLSPQEYSNLVNDINKNLRKSRTFIKIFTILSTCCFLILVLAFLIISILFKDHIFESIPIVASTFSSLLVFPIVLFGCYIYFYLKRNRIIYEYNKYFLSKRIYIKFKEFRGFNGSPKLKIFYPPINHNSLNNLGNIIDDNLNLLLEESLLNDGNNNYNINGTSNLSSCSAPSSSMVSSASSSTSSLNALATSSNTIESSFANEPFYNGNKEFIDNINSNNGEYENIDMNYSNNSIISSIKATPPQSSINSSYTNKKVIDSFSEKTPLLGNRI